jgi:hypothetical protein
MSGQKISCEPMHVVCVAGDRNSMIEICVKRLAYRNQSFKSLACYFNDMNWRSQSVGFGVDKRPRLHLIREVTN